MKSKFFIIAVALALNSGCSVKRMAVNQLGNALAGGGTTFSADDDPELVRDATPFSLKLMESLLAENPQHQGLLLATARGFTQYSYAFVQAESDALESKDLAASMLLRERARKLYARAHGYGMRGLEVNHPGFEKALLANPKKAVQLTTRKDVPLLYWTAAAWGAGISISKDKPDVVADVPNMEALIDRALVLDEKFDGGSIHVFLISYELARAGTKPEEAVAKARQHFDRAMELSGGKMASPLVAFAEQVCVQKQNRAEFETLLKKALAIDVNLVPESRLNNLVMQNRAKWLLSQVDDLFAE